MEIILNESQFNKIFLNENRESKNLSIARNVARSLNPNIDAQKTIDAIRTDIPSSRLNQCSYLPGVVRMYLSGQIQDGKTISSLNSTLKILADAHGNEYNNDLNGLSASELIDRFSSSVRNDFEEKKRMNQQRQFSGKSDYQVVVIPDAETAAKYSKYVSWCVCHHSNMYNSYTHDGIGVFYFLLKNGFENVPRIAGENCPIDEYGLSMIAVSINEDGSINTSTCRWNHDNGGNDHILSDEQLSNLLGCDVYTVLKPIEIKILSENDRFRVFSRGDKKILYDKKLENYSEFKSDGFANAYRSYYDYYYGKVNLKGEFVTEQVYSMMTPLESDGYFLADRNNNGGLVLVNTEGKEWVPCGIMNWDNEISHPTKNGTRWYKCTKGTGLVNLKIGKEIKPSVYESIRLIEEDGNSRILDHNRDQGLINDNFEVIIKPGKYGYIGKCLKVYGQFVRIVGLNADGLVDSNGKEILKPIYEIFDHTLSNGEIALSVKYGSKKHGNLKRGYLRLINNKWTIVWNDKNE